MTKSSRTWVAAAAIMAAALVAQLVVRWHDFYFFSDDFLNFIIAREMGLSRAYLMRDVFGQFIPLYRLVFFLYQRAAGLHFAPWLAIVAANMLAVLAAITRLAITRKASPVLLPVLALAAFSPVFVNTQEWMSAGLEVLPAALFGVVAIALACDAETGWPKWRVVACVACYALGLLFYPKMLVVPVLLFAVRLHERLRRGEAAGLATASALRELLPLLIVAVPYLAIVQAGHYRSGAPRPSVALLAGYVATAWTHGFAAETLALDQPHGRFPWAANIVVTLLAMLSIVRSPRAAVLWAGFALYFVISMGIVGLNRRVVFGLENALTRRYYVDILCYALALALVAHAPSHAVSRRWTTPAALAATAMLALHLMRASAAVPASWYAGIPPVRAYVGEMRASLARQDGDAVLADTPVPTIIMPGWMSPLNSTTYFLTLFPGARTTAPAAQATAAFDDAGRLHAVAHASR